MLTKQSQSFILRAALLVLALLVIALVTLPMHQQSAQAAPAAIPTPISVVDSDKVSGVLTFQAATAISATTTTASKAIYPYRSADVGVTIDQGTSVNTATVTIQYSLDDTNWDDGIAVVSSNAADDTAIVQVPLFARYVRFKQTVTNTENVTVTIKAQAR
jgi:hypothetical protein